MSSLCSKKEPDARRKELLDGLMPEIMSVLLPGEQSSEEVSLLQSLIMSQYGNFVVLELALHASGTRHLATSPP
jgi:hypothetical protein